MDLLIRDVPKDIVLRIDELAAKQHKSRNKYIKEQLNFLAMHPSLKKQGEQYEDLVNNILIVLNNNTKVLKQLTDE